MAKPLYIPEKDIDFPFPCNSAMQMLHTKKNYKVIQVYNLYNINLVRMGRTMYFPNLQLCHQELWYTKVPEWMGVKNSSPVYQYDLSLTVWESLLILCGFGIPHKKRDYVISAPYILYSKISCLLSCTWVMILLHHFIAVPSPRDPFGTLRCTEIAISSIRKVSSCQTILV